MFKRATAVGKKCHTAILLILLALPAVAADTSEEFLKALIDHGTGVEILQMRWNGTNPNPQTHLKYAPEEGVFGKAGSFSDVMRQIFIHNVQTMVLDRMMQAQDFEILGHIKSLDLFEDVKLNDFKKTSEGREFFDVIEEKIKPKNSAEKAAAERARQQWLSYGKIRKIFRISYGLDLNDQTLALGEFLTLVYSSREGMSERDVSLLAEACDIADNARIHLGHNTRSVFNEPHKALATLIRGYPKTSHVTAKHVELALKALAEIYPKERVQSVIEDLMLPARQVDPAALALIHGAIGTGLLDTVRKPLLSAPLSCRQAVRGPGEPDTSKN